MAPTHDVEAGASKEKITRLRLPESDCAKAWRASNKK